MMPPERKIVAESSADLAANAGTDQAEAREEEGDHGGGEDLEEAFHPEMDHPPAPVFDDGQVGVLAPGEAGAVEEADGPGGEQEEVQQVALFAGDLERRARGADHQEQPDEQSNEQQNLPAAAQIDILVPLVPPEEGVGIGEFVLDAHPFAGERADHNEQQGAEQDVDAERLELGLFAADERSDEETGGEPGSGNPEDADLHVPGAADAVGQDVRDLQAVEAVAFDAIVGRHHTHEDLDQDQGRDHPEVFQGGALRGSGGPGAEGIGGRDRAFGLGGLLRGVPPDHGADARQKHDDADAGPQDGVAGGAVADQGFIRPVVGIGDGIAGPFGGGGPGGPEDERGELPHALGLETLPEGMA